MISSGTNGFPKDKVLKIATEAIVDYLSDSDLTVYLVVYDKDSYGVGSKLFSDVTSYIDENYISESEKEIYEATKFLDSYLFDKAMIFYEKYCIKKFSPELRERIFLYS